MPQPVLTPAIREEIARLERADIMVGIPSFKNATTIGYVVRAAQAGLVQFFPDLRPVVVNSDAGSPDGTQRVVVETEPPDYVERILLVRPTNKLRRVSLTYPEVNGSGGKGAALRTIFEMAAALEVQALVVVDSDLRSIGPEWIELLAGPILKGGYDYVAPLYARHKHDGTITNSIAYPLTRALYGFRIRQPIGGEFGFHADLARAYLAQPVWESDVARFGIDIFMTTTAIARGARVAQAFLGAKVHDPKDPAADLGPMFTQVVGTLFRMAADNEAMWSKVKGSKDVPVIGDPMPVEPEAIPADPARLREKYTAAKGAHEARWREILSAPVPDKLDAKMWARFVFDHLDAALRKPTESEPLARSLLPLYQLRTATFIEEVRDMTTAQSETVVEDGARVMEEEKRR